MDRKLQALRRRLEKAELEHLRHIVAEQGARIEALEQDRDYWRDSYICADAQASVFQSMLEDTEFSTHRCVGLTKDGALLVVAQ